MTRVTAGFRKRARQWGGLLPDELDGVGASLSDYGWIQPKWGWQAGVRALKNAQVGFVVDKKFWAPKRAYDAAQVLCGLGFRADQIAKLLYDGPDAPETQNALAFATLRTL